MSPRARHWTRVILVSLGLTIAVSLSAGMLFEILASAHDARRHPRIGNAYDAGATRLNLYCTGQGSPAVILESGLGAPGYSWFRVQPELARFTRACWYDRAGYGWSDPPKTPRDSATIARELHALLGAAGIAPPYVLAGHSFGGFTVRLFNSLYPAEVAGAVLVDSSQEDQNSRLPPALRAEQESQLSKVRFVPVAMNIGLVRLMRLITGFSMAPASLPAGDQDLLDYLQFQSPFFRAMIGELDLFDKVSADAVRNSANFGDKPLIVLTAGKSSTANDYGFHRIWVEELQPRLARLSTRGKMVMVPDSSHMIPFDRPDTVVAAVREVVDGLRSEQSRKERP